MLQVFIAQTCPSDFLAAENGIIALILRIFAQSVRWVIHTVQDAVFLIAVVLHNGQYQTVARLFSIWSGLLLEDGFTDIAQLLCPFLDQICSFIDWLWGWRILLHLLIVCIWVAAAYRHNVFDSIGGRDGWRVCCLGRGFLLLRCDFSLSMIGLLLCRVLGNPGWFCNLRWNDKTICCIELINTFIPASFHEDFMNVDFAALAFLIHGVRFLLQKRALVMV